MNRNILLSLLASAQRCIHVYNDKSGKCSKCGKECSHVWNVDTCSICGYEHFPHVYDGGSCKVCDFEVDSLHAPIVVKGAGSQAVNGVYLCWCSPGVEMIQGPPTAGSDGGQPVMGHYQVGGAHIIIDVLPNFNDGYARWIVHRTNLSSPLYAEKNHEEGIWVPMAGLPPGPVSG